MLDNLNEKQKEIVLYNQGPLMVLAGAGSGKTKAITSKIAYLIQNNIYNENQILAVTFTNKAAKEMKDRVFKLTNIPEWNLNIGTFHSVCLRILKEDGNHIGLENNFNIYDDTDVKTVVREIVSDGDKDNLSDIINYIEKLKNNAYYHGKDLKSIDIDHTYFDYYVDYEKVLKNNNAVDFGGLITKVLELYNKHPKILEKYQEKFRYIFIDEYQDTNKSQFEFVNLLAKKYRNICVVGDIDQSIYSFRDADVRNILSFEKIYVDCKIILLEQNYRSTKNIIEAASMVIKYNLHRKDKDLWTDNVQGDKIKIIECYNDKRESEFVVKCICSYLNSGYDPRDLAIFYRNNHQSRLIEESLRKMNINYTVFGGLKFYDRKEIKDILAYFKIIYNPNDNLSFARALTNPSRGIGNTIIDNLIIEARDNSISLWELLKSGNIKTKLTNGKKNTLNEFVSFIEHAINLVHKNGLIDTYSFVVNNSGYLAMLEKSKKIEDKSRIENIRELRSSLYDYKSLEDFMESVSLGSSENNDLDERKVSLMTVHSSKGLEFETVFVVGAEEELFPSKQSLEEVDDMVGIEEERRLFYVAMTRAKKNLFISYCKERFVYGRSVNLRRSRFINEIPEEFYEFKVFFGSY